MSILSDIQIERLCVAPESFFDQQLFDKLRDAAAMQPITLEMVSPEEKRRRVAAKMDEAIRVATRPTTEEERAAFVPMIAPFYPNQMKRFATALQSNHEDGDILLTFATPAYRMVSYGLTSYGYDVTLSEEFKVFSNLNAGIINPKKFDSEVHLVDAKLMTDEDGAKYVILPPNSYLLGRTNEYFRMPRDVLAVALGKSTYARVGVSVNATPIEPGFEGQVVIEIANQTPSPIMIFANEGISQFLFFQGTEPCRVSYGDRKGKYQGQTGITIAKV